MPLDTAPRIAVRRRRSAVVAGAACALAATLAGTAVVAAPPAQAAVPSIRFGMTSPAVADMQQKLGMPAATGYFGTQTAAYVKAFKRAAHLPVNRKVTKKFWKKLGKVSFVPPQLPAASGTSSVAAVAPGSATGTALPAASSDLARRVMATVASLKGIPYVSNGYDPQHGFNCSSMTQWVYQQVGIDLGGAYTVTQYDRARKITRDQARPGDLVFYYNFPDNFIGHVGIYAGNGMFWHAPHPGRVISLDPIYSSKVLFARVLPD